MLQANSRKPALGYLYIALATLSWGIAACLGRAAFTGRLPGMKALRPIDPMIVSQTRVTFSFLALILFLALRRGWERLALPRRDFRQAIVIGILGVAASNYFYYLAIQRTNVATAIIVQYTAPIWVLLYTLARGQQKPTMRRVGAVGLAVMGIALVMGLLGGRGLALDRVGIFAGLLAAFSFAFYNIGGHDILARHDRWVVLLYTTGSASVFWLVLNPPWKVAAAGYSGAQWLFLLLFSLISVLAAFSFYFAGLQRLEPTRAIVVSCLEPVFSIAIAAIALGELMRPTQVSGIVLVLAAIIVVQLPEGQGSEAMPIVEPIE